ncbi:MAG: class I SAM-dependent methyltransferase [SAR324 cluster bacterium]|nr:class I SAM-dependent methyltransferase [SAR324 cluster bacterium]
MESREYIKMFEAEDAHWWFVSKRKFAEVLLSAAKQSGPLKILDVGCGTGAMSVFLQQYGSVVSMDFSELALSFCKKRNLRQVCRGDALQLPFMEDSFDVVTVFDVLYHQWIKDDVLALKEFHRILKPNGKLLVTDSAFSFLSGKHDQFVLARERYTVEQMEVRLKQAGFQVCKKSYAFFFTFPVVLMVRLIERFRDKVQTDVSLPSPFVNQFFLKVITLEALLLRYIQFPWGSSILILAEKKQRMDWKN